MQNIKNLNISCDISGSSETRYCSICSISALHSQLDLPNKTKKTTGDRAFFEAAPTLWNALLDELRALDSLKTFMTWLKTHLF